MSALYQPKIIEAPVLIGKTIQEAMRIAAQKNMSIRLLDEKEDPDLPIGTIISQNRVPNCPIKAHQSIVVVVSKKTDRKTPNFIGKTFDLITQELKKLDLNCKHYEIAGSQPKGICMAQDPAPGIIMTDSTMTIYICKGQTEPPLFPDLRNKSVDSVKNFLAAVPVNLEIIHTQGLPENHICTVCIVVEQRPRAGSLVTLDPLKPIQVQLRVAPAQVADE